MPIRLFHIGFEYGNPGFPKTDILSQHFGNPDDKVVFDIRESNVLVIGNFLRNNDIETILGYTGPKIVYIGEPIGKFHFTQIFDEFFKRGLYDYAIGCISNNPGKWIKYPFYYGMCNPEVLKNVNKYVSTVRLEEKNLCCLINRHDPGNTRLPILRELTKYIHVVCPGKLANNCSNEELNRIGTAEYIKKFLFNICSENYCDSHPGYITEKLMNCCLGGAIPIYFGNLDEIDERIFNKERILFLNTWNAEEIAKRVMQLCLNPNMMEEFYRRPVFLETAEEALNEIGEGVKTFFKENLGSL